MPKMNREQVEESLRNGEHVAVGTRTLRPGRSPRETRAVLDGAFPSLEPILDDQGNPVRDAGGQASMRAGVGEIDAVVLRGPDGKLTREGMVHVIRQGGSVMLDGEVIDHLEDLPDEVTLARGDEARLQAHLDSLRDQRSRLDLEGRRAHEALEAAKKSAAERPRGEQQEGERRADEPRPPERVFAPDGTFGRTEYLDEPPAAGVTDAPHGGPGEPTPPPPPQPQPDQPQPGVEPVPDQPPTEPAPPDDEGRHGRHRGRRV